MLHSRDRRSAIDMGGQRGLAYITGINEPQTNPEEVETNSIKPVIDMAFNGFAKLNDYDHLIDCAESGSTIAGLQTKTWRVLSYGNASGADQQIVVPVGYNFLVWGIKQHIYFDAAGAAAYNGKYISSEVLMTTPTGTEITKWHGTGHVSSSAVLYAPGHYEFSPLTRENVCVIPAGSILTIVWWSQDGSNFPANTDVIYAIVGQAFPVGAPMPYGI